MLFRSLRTRVSRRDSRRYDVLLYMLLSIVLLLSAFDETRAAGFEGRIRLTIRDSLRGRNIPVTISYASDLENGDNKPLVGTSTNTIPDFSVIVMGHGFQLPVTVYRWLASGIVRDLPGTMVILPETGGEQIGRAHV